MTALEAGRASRPSSSAAASAAPAAAPPHSRLEDVLGLATGIVVASLGIFLLKSAFVVTGGTAGLSLLLSYALPVPFGVLYVVINLPFLVLAVRSKGWGFAVRTVIAVAGVGVMTGVHALALELPALDPVWAVLVGNVLAGLGAIILFRHGASLGGFNILALLLQERLGWRAGYVQMAFDVVVVLASFALVGPLLLALSALGAVVMNLVIALNHRPGRYVGGRP